LVLQTIAQLGALPAALLFSHPIDSLAMSGLILSKVWLDKKIITIDRLGEDFLTRVKNGDTISISEDGTIAFS